jgi:hypothetical protein
MYHRTCRELFSLVDVDYIFIHTNDYGSGLCWSIGLYSGPNSPAHCKQRTPPDRIIRFLDAFRQGAADAGKEINIEINSYIGIKEPEHALDAVWHQLTDHTAVNYRANYGATLSTRVDVNWEYTFAPVKKYRLGDVFAGKTGGGSRFASPDCQPDHSIQ